LAVVPAGGSYAATSASNDDVAALSALAPGVAVSARGIAGDVALKGTVTIGGAKRAGAGVPVFLFASPSFSETAKMKVGDRIQFPLVAATLTDSQGDYAFAASSVYSTLTRMDSPFQEVVVPSSGDSGVTAVNLLAAKTSIDTKAVAVAALAEGGVASTAQSSAQVLRGLMTDNGDIALSRTPTTASELVAQTSRTVAPRSQPAPPEYCQVLVCFFTTLVKSWNQHVGIGQVQSKTNSVSAQLTYQKGSKSTVGIGLSGTGTAGSYSQKTTATVTSSLKIEFGQQKGIHNVYYRTDYLYGKYQEETCIGTWCLSTKYRVAPTGDFVGGNYSVKSTNTLKSKDPAGFCTAYQPGDKVTQDKTKATTWSNGVAIGVSDIKVDLSAQSGYDTNVSAKFTFAGLSKSYLCGVNSAPGNTKKGPGLLYASATKS
jgi:hypothetical protein